MRAVLLSLLVFFFLTPALAEPYVYDYNSRCRQAYDAYMSLNLEEGTNLIKQEIRANPYNLIATFLADYEDCLLLTFNADRVDYEQRRDHFEERLELLSKGSPQSPWYRFCKAGLYLHWAMVYIRMGENFKAATTFRRSYLLAKENQRLFPKFKQNNIILGVQETAAGTIPDDYQWLAAIFGLKGSVAKGMEKLSGFVRDTAPNEPLRREAILYEVYLKFYLQSKQAEVWQYVNSSQFATQNNLLHAFVKANIALNFRNASVALATIKGAQTTPEYNTYPIFDFEMATALQQQLSPDAIAYFQRFLSRTKGRFFVKEAWQRIAFSYYLQGNITKAREALARVKTEGSTNTDADKGALRFANAGLFPNVVVLRARLLFDGGYYRDALEKLQSIKAESLAETGDRLEYLFRLGRIHDELEQDEEAIRYYQQAIALGRKRQEHFAARASLQMGMMLEKKGRHAEALAAYKDCLTMRHHDFQANIDQQAKAGINRLTQ